MATIDPPRTIRRWTRAPRGYRERLGILFDERILPLAAELPADQRHALPMGPDDSCESYFVERRHRRMNPSDFEHGGCTLDNCEQELVRMWQAHGAPHFTGLAAELAKIARGLHEVGTEEGDISEFVYVMY
jgi:hypothetical protein